MSHSRCRPLWQVDLGQDKMVSGVLIQGGKHRDRNVFMKRFRVGHSLNGEDWTTVKEDNTTKAKVGFNAKQKSNEEKKKLKICYQGFLSE